MSMEEQNQKQRPGLSVFIVKVRVSRAATAAKQAALNPRSCPQMRSA
jgi:hypothetical protein